MQEDQVKRLQVMWAKSQNYFQSFLTELDSVRQEINNDQAFAKWCIYELGIGVDIISRTADILRKADAAIARQQLESSREAAREHQRELDRTRRAEAEAARQRAIQQKAEAAARAAVEQEERRAAERKQSKRDSYNRYSRKQRAAEALVKAAAAVSAHAAPAAPVSAHAAHTPAVSGDAGRFPSARKPAHLAQLLKQIKVAHGRWTQSRSEWIDSSVTLASLLCEARELFPSDKAFGEWLANNEIILDKNERAGFIMLGADPRAMRTILENTDSRSIQLISRGVKAKAITSATTPTPLTLEQGTT